MGLVEREIQVAARPERIWDILSALDKYADWESGYVSATYSGTRRSGLGTRREVRLKSPMGVRKALHEISRWEEPKAIAWRAVSSNFPMLRSAEQTVTMAPSGATTVVRNRVEYSLKFGPLGSIVNALMFRRIVKGANQGFLDSLKVVAEGKSPQSA